MIIIVTYFPSSVFLSIKLYFQRRNLANSTRFQANQFFSKVEEEYHDGHRRKQISQITVGHNCEEEEEKTNYADVRFSSETINDIGECY